MTKSQLIYAQDILKRIERLRIEPKDIWEIIINDLPLLKVAILDLFNHLSSS